MAQLTPTELGNWLALYTAASLCCGLAVLLSVVAVAVELHRERAWAGISSLRAALEFLPRTWWRWQKLYFLSMPATLGIVGAFALSMRWH